MTSADTELNEKPTTQSKWNPLNRFGGGPAPPVLGQEADELRIQDKLFLDLPPEMRGMILDMLTGMDHKNCRFVCRRMKYDVEQDIGIRARIILPPPEKSWFENTFLKYLINTAFSWDHGTTTKLEWLKTVRVITLDIKGLNHLPPTIGKSLQSPLSLNTLILRFDKYVQDGLQVQVQVLDDIINRCTCLSNFELVYEASKRFLEWDPSTPTWSRVWREIKTYNLVLKILFPNILQGLRRTRLKCFKILTIPEPDPTPPPHDIQNVFPLPLEDRLKEYYIGMPPLDQILQIDLPTKLQVLEIHAIQFRDVDQPYRLSNQIHLWKTVMDAQTQLKHLSVKIGSIHWRFFEVVLNKCKRSLKSVEIDVCNWHTADSIPDTGLGFPVVTIDVPEEHWFDWTALFSKNCILESLAIRMPTRSHVSANRTKNFCPNFPKLKKLELQYVKLTPTNIGQVLLELPELKELTLKEWYTVHSFQDIMEYKQQRKQTLDWIRNALEKQRLDSIKFFGNLVCQQCPLNSNYRIVNWLRAPGVQNPTIHIVKTQYSSVEIPARRKSQRLKARALKK